MNGSTQTETVLGLIGTELFNQICRHAKQLQYPADHHQVISKIARCIHEHGESATLQACRMFLGRENARNVSMILTIASDVSSQAGAGFFNKKGGIPGPSDDEELTRAIARHRELELEAQRHVAAGRHEEYEIAIARKELAFWEKEVLVIKYHPEKREGDYPSVRYPEAMVKIARKKVEAAEQEQAEPAQPAEEFVECPDWCEEYVVVCSQGLMPRENGGDNGPPMDIHKWRDAGKPRRETPIQMPSPEFRVFADGKGWR